MNENNLCAICKKRIASVFITKMDEKGNAVNQGICLVCAKKMGLPQVNNFLDKMGISDDDLENINDEMTGMLENMDQDMDNPDYIGEPTQNEAGTNSPDFMKFFKNMGKMFPTMPGGGSPMPNPNNQLTANGESDSDEKNKSNTKKQSKDTQNQKVIKNKFLEAYSINLNDKVKDGQIDTVVGRDRELERVIQILNRRTKNNPVLIGEPGVGKTAIAEALALKIVNGDIPYKLRHVQVHMLDLTGMVAGTQFRGQFEARMKGVIDEVKKAGNVILVIDELHNIMGAGEAEGSLNAANILKPALSRGEIQVIGATTLKEYRKYIEKDGALERRFQPVYVEEPTIQETIDILKGIREHYEVYHKVRMSDSVIENAVRMSERYITDRFLPDKAIDVIDEAASRANLRNMVLVDIGKLNDSLVEMKTKLEEEENNEETKSDEEKILNFKEIAELKSGIAKIEEQIVEKEKIQYVDILFDDIARVIENWTGIPVKTVTEQEAERLLHLEERLQKKVIGQDNAINILAKAIRRNRSGFRNRFKPSSFIFVGPTGVGKTELVKQLTLEMFGTIDALVRLDMSEYMEKHTVSKLIGSPPGYVGYDEAGQLTEKIRRRPYSVILFDEIEKAHADVFNMLLQILDDGRLTDSQGRTINFENTIIIMTSNAGTTSKSAGIGFSENQNDVMKQHINDSLKEIFRPEFLNRVDDVIIFNSLEKDSIKKIAIIMLNEVKEQCVAKGITLEIEDSVIDYLVSEGFDDKYGARPLRRMIQKVVEDELAEMHLKGILKVGIKVTAIMQDEKVTLIPEEV